MEAMYNQMEGLVLTNQAAKAKTGIDNYFKAITKNIIPSDEYVTYGNSVVSKVFEVLKTRSKYAIDRTYIAGSAGKHTSVIASDFDCVVFVNDMEPPFNVVLDDFEKVLVLAENVKVKNITKHEFLLQFDTFLPGKQEVVEIDLVPAANFLGNSNGHRDMVAHQVFKTLQKMENYPNGGHKYGTAEAALAFLRQQSGFIHELVRLAKFWNKTLHFDCFVNGRSSLMELLAIDAGQKEEKEQGENRSLFGGFQKFLSNLAGFDTLKIQFTDYNPLKGVNGIDAGAWDRALARAHHQMPYVINPANPYYNFLKEIKRPVLENLQKYAMETLRRMRNNDSLIFDSQPKVLFPPTIATELSTTKQPAFLVGIEHNRSELQPGMIIRNESRVKAMLETRYLKFIQNCLMTSTHAFVNFGPQNKTSSEVQNMMQEMVDVNLLGRAPQTWGSAPNKTHEDHDVTIIIPYSVGDTKCFAMLSMKWN